MRWCASIPTIAALLAARPAAAEPLAEVSARIGAGLAAGGGAGRSTLRGSPVVATFDGAYAINAEPYVWGFAGLVLETYDRTGVGLEGGLAVPVGHRGRARLGARSLVRPYTLHGALVGGELVLARGLAARLRRRRGRPVRRRHRPAEEDRHRPAGRGHRSELRCVVSAHGG